LRIAIKLRRRDVDAEKLEMARFASHPLAGCVGMVSGISSRRTRDKVETFLRVYNLSDEQQITLAHLTVTSCVVSQRPLSLVSEAVCCAHAAHTRAC